MDTRNPPGAASVWRRCSIADVSPETSGNTIHTYFNVSPESPDGTCVLFYASEDPSGETGRLVLRERSTGRETVIATDITAEDAHRAACQQWLGAGRFVAWHDCREGRWSVFALDLQTGRKITLAEDRQIGFGATKALEVPVCGCHWNPDGHRALEAVNLLTGEIHTVTTAEDAAAHAPKAWLDEFLPDNGQPLSVFFPVVSPDGTRVFFKLARGTATDNFKSPAASRREGKFICDFASGAFIRFVPQWGHPSWYPDSAEILEKGNIVLDIRTGQERRLAPIPSDHPSFAPDGNLFVSDGKASHPDFLATGRRVITVGSAADGSTERIDHFDSIHGAKSWRRRTPTPYSVPTDIEFTTTFAPESIPASSVRKDVLNLSGIH